MLQLKLSYGTEKISCLMSRHYLGQMFRKKYGVSFKEYLNNYRIERAAEILLRTDDKIYLVAEEVGYRDLDYFINRFIQSKGCTPTTYRKKTRSVNE